ncbi:MAG: phosphotransferase [Syntrophales bacterium]|nr:phosphotransferase [Syntrophales bacterium]
MERLKIALTWAKEQLGMGREEEVKMQDLFRGGSGRRYVRLIWDKGSCILMLYDTERKENEFFVPLARFLARLGVSVPHILAWEGEKNFVLLEDLGDDTLWSLREQRGEKLWELYGKTIEVITVLHTYPLDAFRSQGLSSMPGFDKTLYQWERDYFRENFVYRLAGLDLSETEEKELETELSMLAERLLSFPSCLIHRDLQSQNIMVYKEKPYLIDFQGLREGNPLYDIASLAYDPYMPLSDEERIRVANYYYEIRPFELNREEFFLKLWEAAAQRLMQALGAYAYLGVVKGLDSFLAYVGPGLKNLLWVTERVPSLSHLYRLARRLEGTVFKS